MWIVDDRGSTGDCQWLNAGCNMLHGVQRICRDEGNELKRARVGGNNENQEAGRERLVGGTGGMGSREWVVIAIAIAIARTAVCTDP